MKRWKNNDWDEDEERDAAEFLELEKEIYLKLFPNNKSLFDGEDEEGEADVNLNDDDNEDDIEVVEFELDQVLLENINKIGDLERLIAKVSTLRINPKEIEKLKDADREIKNGH